jgi:citrate lyase beta subunit
MDLREEPAGDLHLMPYLMQRLIIIANTNGVQPIGAWWRGTSRGLVASSDDTLEAALTGRQAGFKGALCMRAHQVAALNQGFTPTRGEADRAATVMAAFSGAQDNGKSSLHLDGEFIDAARAAIAANLINWAAACEAREQGRATVTAQTEGASR